MSPRHAIRLVPAALGTAFMLALLSADPLGAQTLTNSFGGLSKNSNEPIDIESDLLTVHDAKKYATFSGNVKAVQGSTTMRAKELDVHYVGGTEKLTGQTGGTAPPATPAANQASAPEPATPAPATPAAQGAGTGAQISKIEARGDVVITSEDDQTTTSDWALYDVPAQLVTVGGNVVLTQGQNVLKGNRLVIDLKTGESRFENTGNIAAGGRIRALFMPKQEGAASGAKPAGGKPKSLEPPAAREPAAEESEKPTAAVPKDSAAAPANDAPAKDAEPWQLVPEFR
jgi:lipopolysaccharide export system protein LptA